VAQAMPTWREISNRQTEIGGEFARVKFPLAMVAIPLISDFGDGEKFQFLATVRAWPGIQLRFLRFAASDNSTRFPAAIGIVKTHIRPPCYIKRNSAVKLSDFQTVVLLHHLFFSQKPHSPSPTASIS
jgi:hypothetical protein